MGRSPKDDFRCSYHRFAIPASPSRNAPALPLRVGELQGNWADAGPVTKPPSFAATCQSQLSAQFQPVTSETRLATNEAPPFRDEFAPPAACRALHPSLAGAVGAGFVRILVAAGVQSLCESGRIQLAGGIQATKASPVSVTTDFSSRHSDRDGSSSSDSNNGRPNGATTTAAAVGYNPG